MGLLIHRRSLLHPVFFPGSLHTLSAFAMQGLAYKVSCITLSRSAQLCAQASWNLPRFILRFVNLNTDFKASLSICGIYLSEPVLRYLGLWIQFLPPWVDYAQIGLKLLMPQ